MIEYVRKLVISRYQIIFIDDQDQKSPTFKTSGHDKLLAVPSHMRKNYDVLSKPTIDPAGMF